MEEKERTSQSPDLVLFDKEWPPADPGAARSPDLPLPRPTNSGAQSVHLSPFLGAFVLQGPELTMTSTTEHRNAQTESKAHEG